MSVINLLKKFKKNVKTLEIYSVAQGEIIPIVDVVDDVFSQKILGDGFAIIPSNDQVYSPIKGKITSIFPTKHAIGIQNEQGIDILIHIGIDTVELKGEPFNLFVKEGEYVDKHTLLANVNLSLLKEKNKQSDILVIITSDNYKKLDLIASNVVSHDTHVARLTIY